MRSNPVAPWELRIGDIRVYYDFEDKPIAALVSIKNVDMETISLSNNPQFLALIKHSRERQKSQGGILAEEIRHRLQIGK